MERLRPRTIIHLPTIVRVLALAGIVGMVGLPHDARAAQNWDGPALTSPGGAPYILAGSGTGSVSGAKSPSVAPTTVTRSATTGSAAHGAAGASTKNVTTGSVVPTTRATASAAQGGSLPSTIGGRQATTGNATTVSGPGESAAKITTGNLGAAKPAPKHGAATSPALSLPPFAPVGDPGGQSLDGPTILGLVFKFLVVLALLFIVLRVLKAIMPGGRAKRAGRERPMLLHSESIGDKQRILLLDLGGKLVAVGVAGSAMTQLATIEEADTIDSVRARYAPLAEAVPGYHEGKAPLPLSQSFMETLKRAGIVGQRQAGSETTTPFTTTGIFKVGADKSRHPEAGTTIPIASPPPTMPTVRREVVAMGAGNGRRATRGGEGTPRSAGQPPVEPILLEALEAMRAVRRKVEGA